MKIPILDSSSSLFLIASELAKEESESGAFRSGSITPDGIIDEDFEKELGMPSQVPKFKYISQVDNFSLIFKYVYYRCSF